MVEDLEKASRFILYKKHIFADGSVKPAALVPAPHVECSVTLRANRDDAAVWANGEDVAKARGLPLCGRIDMLVAHIRASGEVNGRMDVVHKPITKDDGLGFVNLYHADIVGWPQEKKDQKSIALRILKGLRAVTRP